MASLTKLIRVTFISGALFLTQLFGATSHILEGETLLNEKVRQKVEALAVELQDKTGVGAYLSLPKDLEEKALFEYEKSKIDTLDAPYTLLSIAKNDQKIDIIYSEGVEDFFDREKILSPFPWEGSILPILTSKKENDNLNAAVINGFADMVEQIAASHDVSLDSAIGSANRNTINILRVIVYGFLAFIILRYISIKVRKRHGKHT